MEHYSDVHLKEGRSLGGGTFQDRRHNSHGARTKSDPKRYGKGKARGFPVAPVAEHETHPAYDDAYPQDEDAEDYDDTSYPAFGDESAEYEAHSYSRKVEFVRWALLQPSPAANLRDFLTWFNRYYAIDELRSGRSLLP